ncbi:MAG: VOC family protein [Hyphomicrobiales bacterium]|nr:VOC family protein [Hyphomicrobiales bacterium]
MSKYNKLTPYLCVSDAAKAIEFYERAFDAEEVDRMVGPDGRILHAEVEINDSIIMLADESGFEGKAAPPVGLSPVQLMLSFKKSKHVDYTVADALAAGAEVITQPHDAYWGMRFGQVRDPFGHVWSFMAPVKKKHKKNDE